MIRLTVTSVLLIALHLSEGYGKNELRRVDMCSNSSMWLTDESSGVLYFSQSGDTCPINLITNYRCRILFEPQDTALVKTCLRLKRGQENVCYKGPQDCDVIYYMMEQDSKRSGTSLGYSDDIRWYTSHTDNVLLGHCPTSIAELGLYDAVINYSVHCYTSVSRIESYSYRLNGTFQSSRFPRQYRTNGEVHYYHLINTVGGRIKLSFDDWNFDSESSLWIYSGSSTPKTYYGSEERPFILSEGSDMVIEFHVSNKKFLDSSTPYIGFRARYEFLGILDDFNWSDKPTRVSESYLYEERRRQTITFQCPYTLTRNWVDYLWVMPRTSRQGYNHVLKLSLGELAIFDELGESLEIRRGNSSLGELINWSAQGSMFIDTQGFYIRLRQHCSGTQRKFNAALEWIANANRRDCGDEGFAYCVLGSGILCRSQLCDRVIDCLDGSDERQCSRDYTSRTTTRRSYVPIEPQYQQNYSFLSILMPLVVVGVITLSISCVIIVCIVRRRRYFIRRRRILREHLERRCNTDSSNRLNDDFGMYDPDQGVVCPPSYEDTLIFDNRGFTGEDTVEGGVPAHPPPYSEVIKPDEEEPRVSLSAVPPAYTDVERPPAPQTRLTLPPLLPHISRVTPIGLRPPTASTVTAASNDQSVTSDFSVSANIINQLEDGATMLHNSADNAVPATFESTENGGIDTTNAYNTCSTHSNNCATTSADSPDVSERPYNAAGTVSGESLDTYIPLSVLASDDGEVVED